MLVKILGSQGDDFRRTLCSQNIVTLRLIQLKFIIDHILTARIEQRNRKAVANLFILST